ncbi:MAG TPA: hypothetical protein VHZ50_11040 [Puia sp.]|nr:hypothetical protein [Puia sp.]
MRSPNVINDAPGDTRKIVDGVEYRKGDKVKLKLGKRLSDAMDMMMDNKMATIEIIYTDYEDKTHIAVTIDDDPGQEMKRELGLYLYFSPDEVEHVK